jgi:CheY-like chemotaxis protein
MTDIDPRHFIEELQFDIKANDLIKAHLVMAHFNEMDAQTQRSALFELSRAPDVFVFNLLVGLLAALPDSGENLSTVKELLYSKALDTPDVLTHMLIREAKPDHRVVLAEIAGEIKLEDATPILLGMLNEEHDEKVLRGAIIALGMIGNATATTPISEFLYAGSVELVIAAIRSLGLLGTPTAIQRLFEKLGADGDLDQMIIDVFAGSQEPEALERLNALLSAKHAYLRNAAKQRLVQIGPKAVPTMINNLHYDDPDLLIHSLNVLGAIGDESAVSPIRKLLHNEPKDPNVRFGAYEALGFLPTAQGAFALAQGLEDPVGNVRAAAARAIDHNYNTVLAAGIKNMIRDEDAAERTIARTIMDAECDTAFLDLVRDKIFGEFAVEYLSRQAHKDIRDHFVQLLNVNGQAAIAARVQNATVVDARGALRVFAVDDSKMILNIYRSVLHNLGCDPTLFELPAEAVLKLASVKPDLIFTDLNMPDISGVELTRAVRRRYTKAQLPIIMVTTQNESQDNDAAMEAGVNVILNKPFNEKMLRAAMEEVLAESNYRRTA